MDIFKYVRQLKKRHDTFNQLKKRHDTFNQLKKRHDTFNQLKKRHDTFSRYFFLYILHFGHCNKCPFSENPVKFFLKIASKNA